MQTPHISAPKKTKKRGPKRKYTKSTRTARRLIKWLRKTEAAKGFPYDVHELSNMKTNDLRTVASLCLGYTVNEHRHLNKQSYIAFILARQSEDVGVGPCPVSCFSGF